MCVDSVDTPTVLRLMKELVVTCNVYIADRGSPNAQLLGIIASYLTQLFKMFGVTGHDAAIGFTAEGEQAVNQVGRSYIILYRISYWL